MGAVVTKEELIAICAKLHEEGKKIVTTNGTFDLLHIGHVRGLQTGRQFGDVLIVGINSDSSVKKYKDDKRPVVPDWARAELLAALECVDLVYIFCETSSDNFVELVKPHVHFKAGQYEIEDITEGVIVRKYGGEVRVVPMTKEFSTTTIIEKVKEAYSLQEQK